MRPHPPDGLIDAQTVAYRRPSGGEGNRTPDLLNAIQALSQLSYTPGSRKKRPSRGRNPNERSRQEPANIAEGICGVNKTGLAQSHSAGILHGLGAAVANATSASLPHIESRGVRGRHFFITNHATPRPIRQCNGVRNGPGCRTSYMPALTRRTCSRHP